MGCIAIKKGLIFSLDAILSLLAAMTLITASFFYLSQIHTIKWSQPNTFITSLDTLNVMRVDKTFREAIKQDDGTKIKDFLDYMYGSNQCGSIEVHKKTNNELLFTENKTGCTHYKSVSVSRRTIFVNRQIYYIVLKMWYQ